MTPIDELEGAGLARAVAEARGWHPEPPLRGACGWYWADGDVGMIGVEDYRPDKDIAQSWELQDEIEAESQHDGQRWWEWPSPMARYVDALCDVCGVVHEAEDVAEWYDGWQMTYLGMWMLIHATPEQRCRAYIKAKEAEG